MELLKNKDISIDQLMFWGLCGTVFFIPLSTSLTVIFGICTLSLWLFSGKFIKGRHRWVREEWTLPVLLFMLIPWAGLLYTKDVHAGLVFAEKSYYWLYAFAITSLPSGRFRPGIIISVFLTGLSLTAAVSIAQFAGLLPMIKSGHIGLHAGFINPITHGLLLVFGITVLAFYFREYNSRRIRVRIFLIMLLLTANLFINPSRAGYIAFIMTSPFIAYKLLGKKHIFRIAVITCLLTGSLFISPVVQKRLVNLTPAEIGTYKKETISAEGIRFHMWEGAVRIFLENPVIGAGTGGYQQAMKKYITPGLAPQFHELSQPHNSFLYMASNFGIAGLISISWLFFALLHKGWKGRHNISGFSLLSFGTIVFIGSFTDTQIIQVHTATLLAILTGIQEASQHEKR